MAADYKALGSSQFSSGRAENKCFSGKKFPLSAQSWKIQIRLFLISTKLKFEFNVIVFVTTFGRYGTTFF